MNLYWSGKLVPLVLMVSVMGGRVETGSAQAPSPTSSGREIFALTAAGAPAGGLPASVRLLSGSVSVATKDGAQMLKASTPTEILITLPEALPRDFTIEFDIIPKQCCNPEDLAFEGTATLSQSSGSARVLWHPDAQTVMGGGAHYQSATPADLRETTRGQLTHIVASFEGETFKLYTNGRRLYTLTERRFARGRVLRVFLGGQDDGDQAVYLAKVRVLAGAATTIAATGQAASTGTLVTNQSGDAIRAAGSGAAPATTTTSTSTPATSVMPRTSAGATNTGPVTTTAATSPVTETRVGLFAPPAQRAIRVAGFIASGVSPAPSRTVQLSGFLAGGTPPIDVSRTLRLTGFTAVAGEQPAAQRTVRLTGITAAGQGTTELLGPAPRTIRLPGYTTSAGVVPAASRSIRLTAIAAVGGVTAAASRRIRLPGFTWNGGAGTPAPRIIRLTGWTVTGQSITP